MNSAMTDLTHSRCGPLAGIKVLDLSAYIAGPYACALLADQGATVIKIEPPAGDNLRNYPSTLDTESRAFLGVNRGKLGVVLDLKQTADRLKLDELVKTADVLVHNFRPSVPQKLGIDYARLQSLNPRLIYCALTGFGQQGPMKDRAGYDQVLQSMTGMCAMQGKPDGPPEVLYGSVVDFYAAALLSGAVSSALYEREKSGTGQEVAVSLLGAALAMQSTRLVWADGEPRDISRDMRSGGVTGIHPTRDGYLYISANTAHFWQTLCERIGLAELAKNERYNTVRKRSDHQDELLPKLHAALAQKSAQDWEDIFGADVPCSVVRTVEDMFDHPQVMAQQMIGQYEHPVVGHYRALQNPVQFSRTACAESFAAPTLGQHNNDVFENSGEP